MSAARPHKSPARKSESAAILDAKAERTFEVGPSTSEARDPNDPATYRHTTYNVNKDLEDIYGRWDGTIAPEQLAVLEAFSLRLFELRPSSERELVSAMITLRREFKVTPKRSQLLYVISMLEVQGALPRHAIEARDRSESQLEQIRRLLVKKVGCA